jgi:methylated-DNA-[protein]-cysteine S-methyltransferase
VQLRRDELETPIGTMAIVVDPQGALVALDWDDHAAQIRAHLEARYGNVVFERGVAPEMTPRLRAYFGGDIDALRDIPVSMAGTPFQRRVWEALRSVPPGTTTSYGAIARAVGRPGAARAVGVANGRNPIAIVVPCHRIIGANGTLVGYGGGLDRKRWLLAHESRCLHAARDGKAFGAGKRPRPELQLIPEAPEVVR